MSKRKVIPRKNLPVRYPSIGTLTVFMAIKLYDISGIWLGVIYSFLVIWWGLLFWAALTEEEETIFEK